MKRFKTINNPVDMFDMFQERGKLWSSSAARSLWHLLWHDHEVCTTAKCLQFAVNFTWFESNCGRRWYSRLKSMVHLCSSKKLHRHRPCEGDLHQTRSRVSVTFVENLFKSALSKVCFLRSCLGMPQAPASAQATIIWWQITEFLYCISNLSSMLEKSI